MPCWLHLADWLEAHALVPRIARGCFLAHIMERGVCHGLLKGGEVQRVAPNQPPNRRRHPAVSRPSKYMSGARAVCEARRGVALHSVQQ